MVKIKGFFNVILGNKKATAGLLILLFFFIMALFGPILVELDNTTRYSERLQGASFKHWLGTDYAGRDTLAILIHGSRDVLSIAFLTGVITVAIAFVIGTVSGVLGGRFDDVLMMITNVVLTVPSFPVMMVLSLIINIKSPFTFAAVLSLWSWAGLARTLRAQILSLKQRDFIEVSKIMAMPLGHIIFKEMLPNMISYISINFIMIMRGAIAASVGLMLLGLVPFSSTNWGMMLNLAMTQTGALYNPRSMMYLLSPIFAITLFQMGCLFFTSGLDQAFDPRLRT